MGAGEKGICLVCEQAIGLTHDRLDRHTAPPAPGGTWRGWCEGQGTEPMRREPPAGALGDTRVFISWDRLRGILKSAGEVLQDDTVVSFSYGHMGLDVYIKQDPESQRRTNPYTREPLRCQYDDCRYPVASEGEQVTCLECRSDLSLPPLARVITPTP